jgi:hypothetical protein
MEKALTPEHARSLSQAVPFLLDFPASRFWVDYDKEADCSTLALHAPKRPQIRK